MHSVLFAIWFFLPAGIANASPVFTTKIKPLHFLLKPIDFGKTYHGKRMLGDSKTWLGLIGAVITGIVVIGFQKYGFVHSEFIRIISGSVNYQASSIWLLGALLGFGAIAGDTIESFIKRRVGIKPGRSWFPFDQIDYIVGGIIASLFVVRLNFGNYALILILWFGLHLLSAYIGYLLKLKPRPI